MRGVRRDSGLPVNSGQFVLYACCKYDIVTLPKLEDGEVSDGNPAFFMLGNRNHTQHFMAAIITYKAPFFNTPEETMELKIVPAGFFFLQKSILTNFSFVVNAKTKQKKGA